jgi:hypothetical protein
MNAQFLVIYIACNEENLTDNLFQKISKFFPLESHRWSRRSLWRNSLSARVNFKPHFWMGEKLFHVTITPIKDYWNLLESNWLLYLHLHTFTSTQKRITQLKRAIGLKIVPKWAEKEKWPPTSILLAFCTSYCASIYLQSSRKQMICIYSFHEVILYNE